jgi:hypothetical protein
MIDLQPGCRLDSHKESFQHVIWVIDELFISETFDEFCGLGNP